MIQNAGNGWKSAARENARLSSQRAKRAARLRALKCGEATPLADGRKLLPDTAAAIEHFLQARQSNAQE